MAITDIEKEKMIYQAVSDIENQMAEVIESCHPIGLSNDEYLTCVTLSLFFVIESLAAHATRMKLGEVTFDMLMQYIFAAREKALKIRKKG